MAAWISSLIWMPDDNIKCLIMTEASMHVTTMSEASETVSQILIDELDDTMDDTASWHGSVKGPTQIAQCMRRWWHQCMRMQNWRCEP